MYVHGGEVYRRIWEQYNSTRSQKSEMAGGRGVAMGSTESRGIQEVIR